MRIDAAGMHFKMLNDRIRDSQDRDIFVENCQGQRYLGDGLCDKRIEVQGIPGNALGAYLNGATLVIKGNAQDATGDTMNEGKIIIHGSSGDATGYAMRGGKIFVKGSVGYRAGIHMKAYQTRIPVLTIGASAGCFLGEYQAGGLIIVLNLKEEAMPVGEFCGTGMHGGKMFICCHEPPRQLPNQVLIHEADKEMLQEIMEPVAEFCQCFGYDMAEVLARRFHILTPNTKNPYRQLYTHN